MKKLILNILFTLSIPLLANAQISLAYQAGYGTYRMHSLSDYQKFVLSASALPAKIVTHYPGYLNHKIIIGLPTHTTINKFYFGYLTTAGRISLTDYSGKWLFDQKLYGFQIGSKIEFPLTELKDFKLTSYVDFGFTTTVMKMNQYLAIGEETSEESLSFIGYGLNIQPGFQWRYLKQKYSLGLFLGYELAITKPFFVKGHYDTKLGISSNNLTKPDWSGLRTGVEICYKFGN